MEIGKMGGIFLKELVLVPLDLGYTEYHQKKPITSSKICLSISNFSPVRFFPRFYAFCQKTEPSRGTFEPQTNGTVHKFANIQTAFDIWSTLVLRDNSKWRANKSEYGKVDKKVDKKVDFSYFGCVFAGFYLELETTEG